MKEILTEQEIQWVHEQQCTGRSINELTIALSEAHPDRLAKLSPLTVTRSLQRRNLKKILKPLNPP